MRKPILLTVDDDPAVSQAITRTLRRKYASRYRVLRAESGPATLEMLCELKLSADEVALLLADHRVLGMTGIDLLEQEIDIHRGIEKTLVILGHKLRAGVEVVRDYDDHLPRVLADGSELNQVWTNLVDNAIDAMDGHGELRIRTRHDEHAVLVEIVDQGSGIPPKLASRIFDRFFTTKEVGKGTGLGLDIVRRIVVDWYNGEVSFGTVSGEKRFLVRLPLTTRTWRVVSRPAASLRTVLDCRQCSPHGCARIDTIAFSGSHRVRCRRRPTPGGSRWPSPAN